MKKFPTYHRLFFIFLIAILLTACGAPAVQSAASQDTTAQEAVSDQAAADSLATAAAQAADNQASAAATWNEATHGKGVDPDYATVFPQDAVNRIDITLTAEAWTALQDEMAAQFGTQGEGGTAGVPGQMPGGQPPQGQPPDNFQPGGQQPPQGQPRGDFQPGAMGGAPNLDFGNTSYVPAAITFNGETWESVGFRYSGNSTLQSSWRTGTEKISFRLDFDEFEDVNPATTDQRFYGFKQLSFKSSARDSSYIREKVVADIFREAGVAASQTAFYEVYIDYGDGPQYFGLYTAVEIVDDTLIETQFSDDSGNVYKPEGSGAAFVEGTFNEASFEKQTNEDEADWSDIQAVFEALHSDLRTTDPAAWRAGLEAVFDVDAFIRWLAVDTIIQNWDTYGTMSHNYYLYTDPTDGLVTWIPWDNNEALSAAASGPGGGGDRPGGGGGMNRGVREIDQSNVTEQWPLIRYLIDDPVYKALYDRYLDETIQGAFNPDELAVTYQRLHDLIAPYVEKETEGRTQLTSLDAFNQSVAGLINHAQSREVAVLDYLGK